MSLTYITGNDLLRSIKAGCIKLEHNRDSVDLLNVFPVPDGDTGTNMYLTLMSAVREGEKNRDKPLGKLAKSVSMGSLMGARGNSGVILSQIFRGMAKVLEGKDQASAMDIAQALKTGADTAYEAVMKPVEGTILTVAREIGKACEAEAKKNDDVVAVLLAGIQTGHATLARTPSMLPILKEAGVVDAGGRGFLFFLEGFVEGLAQEREIKLEQYREQAPAEVTTSREEIKLDFQYCTEVLIKGQDLDPLDVRDHLAPLGDSLLVVGGDDVLKVHMHSNHPGKVLETCLQWGQLSDIKINNMLEEVHEHRLIMEEASHNQKAVGLVAVSAGDGVGEILESLGVDMLVQGGQTMNPSTEDLLNACNQVDAQSVIILPNNSNIIMSARQVVELCDKKVVVVPTRSVMQAITALIAYDSEGDIEEVAQEMTSHIDNVTYGEVTYAVRDSAVNGLTIKEGDTIGLIQDKVVLTSTNAEEAVIDLLKEMINEDSELITLLYGEGVTEADSQALKERLQQEYPDKEVEVHYGGQPHYSYWLSVE